MWEGEGVGGAFILYFFFSLFLTALKLDFSENRGNVRYPIQDVDSNGKKCFRQTKWKW